MPPYVHAELRDAVAIVELDRVPMNVLCRQMQEEFLETCLRLARMPEVRVVVVQSAHEHFAAGADVDEIADFEIDEFARACDRISRCLGALSLVPQPTIALVSGFALGGGLEIALGADRRIVTRKARLGLPEVLLGVIPGGGGTQRLAEVTGRSAAKDLIWTGRIVDSAEALSLGLVDEVVDDRDALLARGMQYAEALADGPLQAILAAKRAIDGGGANLTTAEGLALESHLFTESFDTDDRRVGMRSFRALGPGKARFSGT